MRLVRPHVFPSLLAFAFLSLSPAPAGADDALGELKTGYALKQAGRCAEAIPHFTRSFELDPKPKAILNLADCEAQTGDLVDARSHAARGGELASQVDDTKLQSVAADQLAAIDTRLPKLTIRLAAGSPQGCSVTLDGRPLDPSSLGAEVGVNPGTHHVVASAQWFEERGYDVNVVEGARLQLEVQPGPGTGRNDVPSRASAPQLASNTAPASNDRSTLRALSYASLGTGAVALTVGIVFGESALSKNSRLESECGQARVCTPDKQSDVDSFNQARTVSDIGYVIGIAGLGGGVVLWLLGSSSGAQRPEARLWFGPTSVGMQGAF